MMFGFTIRPSDSSIQGLGLYVIEPLEIDGYEREWYERDKYGKTHLIVHRTFVR